MDKQNIMESTVKIDVMRDSDGETPVIKIIQPVKFTEPTDHIEGDGDVRDTLIQDFMHRPCYTERNSLFRTASSFKHPIGDNPTHWITTIEAVKQEDMFEFFKWRILGAIIPDGGEVEGDLSKCVQFHNSGAKDKAPAKYGDYERVVRFFDWLEELVKIPKD